MRRPNDFAVLGSESCIVLGLPYVIDPSPHSFDGMMLRSIGLQMRIPRASVGKNGTRLCKARAIVFCCLIIDDRSMLRTSDGTIYFAAIEAPSVSSWANNVMKSVDIDLICSESCLGVVD